MDVLGILLFSCGFTITFPVFDLNSNLPPILAEHLYFFCIFMRFIDFCVRAGRNRRATVKEYGC